MPSALYDSHVKTALASKFRRYNVEKLKASYDLIQESGNVGTKQRRKNRTLRSILNVGTPSNGP